MSFTLYVMAIDQPFTETQILSAFGSHISPDPHGELRVHYDEQNESTLFCDFEQDGTADSFSVHRPCGDDRLFVALHQLLSNTSSFLTYPDEETICLVATDASAEAVRAKYPELSAALRVCPTPESLVETW